MAKRESFLLRTDPRVLNAMRKWAADDLRSVNAQIEFVLRQVLRANGRLEDEGGHDRGNGDEEGGADGG